MDNRKSSPCYISALGAAVFCCQSLVWAQEIERGFSAGELMRIIGLLAAVSAIVLLVGVEFLWRSRLEGSTYRWLLFVGLLVLPALVALSATTTVFEETKTVNSCASCHVMHPFVRDMMNPTSATLAAEHFRNKWISDHQCYACHTTYGIHGTMAAKRDGFRHWLLYVTGTWQEPIQYSGSYPNSTCLTCHVETPKFERVASHHALRAHLETNRVGCFTCHGPAHPTPDERQTVSLAGPVK